MPLQKLVGQTGMGGARGYLFDRQASMSAAGFLAAIGRTQTVPARDFEQGGIGRFLQGES
jgi:hypothetical protein